MTTRIPFPCALNLAAMPLSLYWNHRGEPHEIEDCPESIEHWDAGQPLNEPQRTIVQTVEEVLSVQVTQMDVRAMSRNAVSPQFFRSHECTPQKSAHNAILRYSMLSCMTAVV